MTKKRKKKKRSPGTRWLVDRRAALISGRWPAKERGVPIIRADGAKLEQFRSRLGRSATRAPRPHRHTQTRGRGGGFSTYRFVQGSTAERKARTCHRALPVRSADLVHVSLTMKSPFHESLTTVILSSRRYCFVSMRPIEFFSIFHWPAHQPKIHDMPSSELFHASEANLSPKDARPYRFASRLGKTRRVTSRRLCRLV